MELAAEREKKGKYLSPLYPPRSADSPYLIQQEYDTVIHIQVIYDHADPLLAHRAMCSRGIIPHIPAVTWRWHSSIL